jgi:phosphoribosylformylglycinamidine cyclo-ligase
VSESRKPPLSYVDAGVDIDAGDALVEAIKPIAARTARPGTLGAIGGFGGCFRIAIERYKEPVLVAGTDGVGTKVKLAGDLARHDTIGIDLVAMCANDIIVQGAEPLFFLDYYATGKLDTAVATRIIEGIAKGCRLAGMALIGGETAEMPGVYAAGDCDLAGFAVGIVERAKLLDGSTIVPGDILVGLTSSGIHANGYSLVRKIVQDCKVSLQMPFAETTLGDVLLTPTRVYVKPVLRAIEALDVHALAHITGGGLVGNLPRVLPEGVCALIDSRAWQRPAIFDWLQEQGNVDDAEMYRTFNCGIGMVLVVSAGDANAAVELLRQQGETALIIGHTAKQSHSERIVIR